MTDDQGLFLQQNAADTLLRNTSSLQVLLNMGFPKDRALKALAATGDCGIQIACDWIFAHVKDPSLNQVRSREFILYACPTGQFGIELDEFWQQSLVSCGRNGVHNSFPHITLCSFFKCKDENVSKLVHSVTSACKQTLAKSCPDKFGLEYFSTQNYVGLFLQEDAANFLRKLSDTFAEEAKNVADTSVEPHSNKQLHITLAYKFPVGQLSKLEQLANKLDLSKTCSWEIRLYSKDPKFSDCETLRVLYPYSPTADNHLQLINGDCVFVGDDNSTNASKSGLEGWFYGTSWMTGCSGFFPASHTERSIDTETWTTHKKIVLTSARNAPSTNHHLPISRRYSNGADEYHNSGYHSSRQLLKVGETLAELSFDRCAGDKETTSSKSDVPVQKLEKEASLSDHKNDLYATVNKPREVKGILRLTPIECHKRRVYIFRHAERVDVTFGKQWMYLSFDEQGNYHRRNLNMPSRLPKRNGAPDSYTHDCPITEMGSHQAFLNGQAMKDVGIKINHVYCSPALRCVQTVHSILNGLGADNLPINTDIALYEWMKWSPTGLPSFVEANIFQKFGINVSTSYQSKITDLPLNERCRDYFKRCHDFLVSILNETTGDVLIASHAGALDGLTRLIQGLGARPMPEFVGIVTKVPYCGSVVLEKMPILNDMWQLIDPPYPALTHAPNPVFNWKMLIE